MPRHARGAATRADVPLLVAGTVSIVAGGVVAAVTGPTGWRDGSWVAAFLVLVAGVAQVALAVGQDALAVRAVTPSVATAECAMWNVGCLTVIAGTLLSQPALVAIGSAPLVATLVVSSRVARGPLRRRRLALAYRTLVVVLLASIPVGIALAWIRH